MLVEIKTVGISATIPKTGHLRRKSCISQSTNCCQYNLQTFIDFINDTLAPQYGMCMNLYNKACGTRIMKVLDDRGPG